jgi:hypothetical protein
LGVGEERVGGWENNNNVHEADMASPALPLFGIATYLTLETFQH